MTRSDCAVALIVAPVAALAIGWLLILAVARTGEHPLWNIRARNLAEAAAFRDGGEIVRRLRRGENPAVSGEVRAGFISQEPVTVTPLEAAARARRDEVVRLLLDLGTPLDAASWTRVRCSTDAPVVREVLEPYRPPGATDRCPGEEGPRDQP